MIVLVEATKSLFESMGYGRKNNCRTFHIDWARIYQEGSFKKFYSGVFMDGPRSKQPCVAKESKQVDDNFASQELKNAYKALKLVTRFNEEMEDNPKYHICMLTFHLLQTLISPRPSMGVVEGI